MSFQNNRSNYNHVFNELQDYMFYNEMIYKFSNKQPLPNSNNLNKNNVNLKKKSKSITNNVSSNQELNIEQSVKSIEKDDFFYPQEKDKLFWCFYVLLHGISKYEFIKTVSFKTETEFKFKTADKIKDYKDTLNLLKMIRNKD